MENKDLTEKLKYHLVDSTAILAEGHPVYSAIEVGIAGMSIGTSIDARLMATALCYAGIGWIYSKGRDLCRGCFKINDRTSEKIQTLHDIAYSAGFSLIFSPLIYFLSGSRDLKEIAVGTGCATIFAVINGSPTGYSIDSFRDLTGLKACERELYPEYLKNQNPKIKKGIAIGLVAASIGVMSLVYYFNDSFRDNPKEGSAISSTLEKKVDSRD